MQVEFGLPELAEGFTDFDWVKQGFFFLIEQVFTGLNCFYRYLYRDLTGFAGFYGILLGFTGFEWV